MRPDDGALEHFGQVFESNLERGERVVTDIADNIELVSASMKLLIPVTPSLVFPLCSNPAIGR